MPTIDANGLRVGYEVAGDGAPVVALHGASMSGIRWLDGYLDGSMAGGRVYAPDARGHGATRWDVRDGFTTADLAADVVAFADAMGLATFHLFGLSMGGMTALHVATSHPDRLRSLVVVSIGTDREPRGSVGRRFLDPDRIERDDPRWARRLAAQHDPIQGVGAWRRLLHAITADVDHQSILDAADLRRVGAPALVACGDRDPFTPVGQAWDLRRALRDARLLVVPGSGHDVLAHPSAVFADALAEFYGEVIE